MATRGGYMSRFGAKKPKVAGKPSIAKARRDAMKQARKLAKGKQ